MQVDFTASNRQLHVRAGTMGIVDNKGGTFGIVQTTKEIFEQFWTDNCVHSFRQTAQHAPYLMSVAGTLMSLTWG